MHARATQSLALLLVPAWELQLSGQEACSDPGQQEGLRDWESCSTGGKVAETPGPPSRGSSTSSSHLPMLRWAWEPITTVGNRTAYWVGGSTANKKWRQHWECPKTCYPHDLGSMAIKLPPPLWAPRKTNKDANSGGPGHWARNPLPVMALCLRHCSPTPCHCSLACHASVCRGHPIPTITRTLLVPMACRDHRSTHPEVTVPCPGSTSKRLAPFTDGIICQILSLLSLRKLKRTHRMSQVVEHLPSKWGHEFKSHLSCFIWFLY
jgi:hypothetical protein